MTEMVITVLFICCCIPFILEIVRIDNATQTAYYNDKSMQSIHAEKYGNNITASIPIDFGGAVIIPLIQNDYGAKAYLKSPMGIAYHWDANYEVNDDSSYTTPIASVSLESGWEAKRYSRFLSNRNKVATTSYVNNYANTKMYLVYNRYLGCWVATKNEEFIGYGHGGN